MKQQRRSYLVGAAGAIGTEGFGTEQTNPVGEWRSVSPRCRRSAVHCLAALPRARAHCPTRAREPRALRRCQLAKPHAAPKR